MRPETASCHERREITFPAGSSRRALSPVFVKLSFVSSERNLFTAPGARITSRISNGLLPPSLSSRNHPERFTALLPTLVISTHSFPSSAPIGCCGRDGGGGGGGRALPPSPPLRRGGGGGGGGGWGPRPRPPRPPPGQNAFPPPGPPPKTKGRRMKGM